MYYQKYRINLCVYLDKHLRWDVLVHKIIKKLRNLLIKIKVLKSILGVTWLWILLPRLHIKSIRLNQNDSTQLYIRTHNCLTYQFENNKAPVAHKYEIRENFHVEIQRLDKLTGQKMLYYGAKNV